MLLTNLFALSCTLFGNILIYIGIAFVNTQLLPNVMQGVYAQLSLWPRVLIMSVVTAPIVNYLFSVAYQKVGAGNAGMMIISTLALVLIAKAVLIHGGGLNMRIGFAAAVLIAAAAWVAYELHRVA